MKMNAIRIVAGLLAAALPGAAVAAEAVPAETTNGAAAAAVAPVGEFEEISDSVESPNLSLQTVQRKEFSDAGRHEITLFPAVAQLNTKFTQHFGVGGQYSYHLHENFALQAQGSYFYINGQTPFTEELIGKGGQSPQAATALTLQWAATGGFELTPLYGKFSFYEGTMGHFGLVLTGGVGLGGTRIQLQSSTNGGGEATFGDTGVKFMGQIGAGFRVFLTENLLMRLEVKDLIYTAKVDTINGCNAADLDRVKRDLAPESGSCRENDFQPGDAAIAEALVREPSSDVLNNVGVYGGISYAF
jgi:outer membrane beta-barrel protein